jgi:DNA-binding transcriptional LysR family regulator
MRSVRFAPRDRDAAAGRAGYEKGASSRRCRYRAACRLFAHAHRSPVTGDTAGLSARDAKRPLARRKSVSLAEAPHEAFVSYNREEYPDYQRRLYATFAKVRTKPRIVEEHDGFSSIIPAIEAGRGVALVTESFGLSSGKRVRLLRLTPEPTPSTLAIAAPAGPLSTVAEKFWQCAKQVAQAIRDRAGSGRNAVQE